MSLTSKILVTAAAALASNQVRNLIAEIDLDDLLQPMGLVRRRNHLGGAIALVGVGVVVGGAAAFLLSSSTAADLRGRIQAKFRNPEASANGADANAEPEPVERSGDMGNFQSGASFGHS